MPDTDIIVTNVIWWRMFRSLSIIIHRCLRLLASRERPKQKIKFSDIRNGPRWL
jgi:hypothetical protein